MITISLCMIVKDEEDVISRCLESAKDIADEIILVDTGSTDKTKELAQEYTPHVYDLPWVDDFSAARNFSFSKATQDYILWLDADDVILEEDKAKFKDLKSSLNPSTDVVMMKYNVGFDDFGNVTMSYFRERLLKRSNRYQWREPIHEYIELYGNIINSDICITHKKLHAAPSDRNLNIFEKMVAEGKTLSARSLFYYARELYYHARYQDAIHYFDQFLNSGKGWVEDNISASYHLSLCYDNLHDKPGRLKALLRSLEYDIPRAEICCQLGYHYFDLEQYDKAIFWYELASNLKKPEQSWGFILHDCWGYLPCIQLCVCYDRLGNTEKAMEYNNRAGGYKPEDSAVLYNKKYFEELMKE